MQQGLVYWTGETLLQISEHGSGPFCRDLKSTGSHARWVVDGNIYTTSGVSAGIDGTFAFMEDIYGADVTQDVSDILEYQRWLNASYDPFADLYGLPYP